MSCNCVDPNPITCLAVRNEISQGLSHCMGGCQCRCHRTPKGTMILRGEWEKNKKRVARPARPEREEAVA